MFNSVLNTQRNLLLLAGKNDDAEKIDSVPVTLFKI